MLKLKREKKEENLPSANPEPQEQRAVPGPMALSAPSTNLPADVQPDSPTSGSVPEPRVSEARDSNGESSICSNAPEQSCGGQTHLKVAYADPPYPGMSGYYRDHPDYAGEVDHRQLMERLQGFDGWCLHTASTTLKYVLSLAPEGVRVMAWVKPFAAFKKNVAVAYAWEPVLVKPCRMRKYDGVSTIRDWCAEPITLQRGLTGAKPAAVCRWLFEVMGMNRGDELHDLFPGTGGGDGSLEELALPIVARFLGKIPSV